MADAATARRQARRRKILANSHNRLQLISGNYSGDLPKEPQPAVDPNQVWDIGPDGSNDNDFLSNGAVSSESFLFEASTMEGERHEAGRNRRNNESAGLGPQVAPDQEMTLQQKLSAYRYDVVAIALVIKILCEYSYISLKKTNFFLPLVFHIIPKFIRFPKPINYTFANAILVMNGISAPTARTIMVVIHHVSELFQDGCVYLFTSVCINAIYPYIVEAFIENKV